MKSKKAFYAALIITFISSALVYFVETFKSPDNPQGYGIYLKSLRLSDELIENLKDAKLEYRKRRIDIIAQRQKAVLDLSFAITKDTAKKEILKKADTLAAIKKKNVLNRVEYILETSKLIKDNKKRKAYLERMTSKGFM